VILKIKRPKKRIPLPKQIEQAFKVKMRYSRKLKYKKDWRDLEDASEYI